MRNEKAAAVCYAIAAAVFYALNVPCSKLLLERIAPTYMAAFLYLGAGAGVGIMYLFHHKDEAQAERLEKIEGIHIKRIPRKNDSICDFVAEMGDILFAYDSFELTPEAIDIIDQLSTVIIDIPTRIEVIGHTDNYGTDEYNLNLSKMRAMAVGNRLRDNGITDITEIGKGESEPIATNKTAEGRKKNRRVEIKMFTEE